MLTTLIFADTTPGRFNASLLSPHERMELLIGCLPASRRHFQDADRNYYSIEKWPGVTCNSDGSPSSMLWAGPAVMEGSLTISLLPDTVRKVELRNQRFTGSFEFAAFPNDLQEIFVHGHRFTGSVDLTALPAKLERLDFTKDALHAGKGFEGTINLT